MSRKTKTTLDQFPYSLEMSKLTKEPVFEDIYPAEILNHTYERYQILKVLTPVELADQYHNMRGFVQELRLHNLKEELMVYLALLSLVKSVGEIYKGYRMGIYSQELKEEVYRLHYWLFPKHPIQNYNKFNMEFIEFRLSQIKDVAEQLKFLTGLFNEYEVNFPEVTNKGFSISLTEKIKSIKLRV